MTATAQRLHVGHFIRSTRHERHDMIDLLTGHRSTLMLTKRINA